VAVDDGLEIVEDFLLGVFGFLPRDKVLDCYAEGLGDAVGFGGVWKTFLGYPPTECLDAYVA